MNLFTALCTEAVKGHIYRIKFIIFFPLFYFDCLCSVMGKMRGKNSTWPPIVNVSSMLIRCQPEQKFNILFNKTNQSFHLFPMSFSFSFLNPTENNNSKNLFKAVTLWHFTSILWHKKQNVGFPSWMLIISESHLLVLFNIFWSDRMRKRNYGFLLCVSG